jgi:prophage tail gpP-like protein
MADSAELRIAGQVVRNFISYTVESDIYTADDAFSLELANPEIRISTGQRCELYINGALELDGIIDRVIKGYDKQGVKLRVEGRDLMGLLVDSHCEKFDTIQGMTVKALAEKLIAPIPFISRGQISYQANFVGKTKGKKQTVSTPSSGFLDTPQKISQIEPGMTVFEVLRTYAASRGYMFWLEYGGAKARFVIGRPKTGGAASYFLCCQCDGRGNNILEGEQAQDIAKRYSRVTVISQQQGQDDLGTTNINVKSVKVDSSFPFVKPLVVRMTNDSQSPALHARLLMEKQRHDGFQLHYRVPGHSQAGINWAINEICQVRDEVLEIDDTYLIFGRTFERTKQGTFTRLKLGLKGLVA